MRSVSGWLCCGLLAVFCAPADAQQALTWAQVKARFEVANPNLRAGQIGVEESRAQEITAFLRPNPDITATIDQIDPFNSNPYRPLGSALPLISTSYLYERQHKRQLRLDSARRGTLVAASQQEDLERTLLYSLRGSFVTALQAKAVLALAKENLEYYDKVLGVSRDRLGAGDIAPVDMKRLELQRAQYESDLQVAEVNVRTAKIQLLALMNDRTPLDQFDVTGPFEPVGSLMALEDVRRAAIETRPDLRAAAQAVEKARADYALAVANGSADPTFSVDSGRNPPISAYLGFSVSFPLRIFDRNQGEKERTNLDIRRNQQLQAAAQAQVISDVDSAWETLAANLKLVDTYNKKYLTEATEVRDTVAFAYQHGGASLLDFLSAQSDYRSIRLNYINLVGAGLSAATQLNLAVGREVIP